jgi:hypothetical protein
MALRKTTRMANGRLSPKTAAAGAAALLAPLIARVLADVFEIDVDSETVEGLILASIAAISAFAAAYATPPGETIATVTDEPVGPHQP